MNWKEAGSLIAAGLTIVAGAWLGFTGALPIMQAGAIVLAGLAIIGIHPAINTSPVAGRTQ
jgi:hypothetical protein